MRTRVDMMRWSMLAAEKYSTDKNCKTIKVHCINCKMLG